MLLIPVPFDEKVTDTMINNRLAGEVRSNPLNINYKTKEGIGVSSVGVGGRRKKKNKKDT